MNTKKYNNWKKDLRDTNPALDIIKDLFFKDSELISIEESGNETLIWFDRYAGIDWVGKNLDNQIIGVAVRIQWDINYRTFTIRSKRHTGTKTELEKRKEAIRKGYIYPTYTLQAYFKKTNPPELLSACMVETKALYRFIKKYPDLINEKSSDNIFKIIKWKDLQINGVQLIKEKNIPIQLPIINNTNKGFFTSKQTKSESITKQYYKFKN